MRELTFKRGFPEHKKAQIHWYRIKQLDDAVELPYLAPQLMKLLASSSLDALRAIRAMDVSLQALHMTQIMANVAQSIGPYSISFPAVRDIVMIQH